MGYDASNPATWSVKRLLEYARQRNISVPSGCEKPELVAFVNGHFTDELLAEQIRKEQTLETAHMPDILSETPATILRHVANTAYTDVLRRHPATLQSILDAGLAQLQSLTFVARLCSAQVHSPLQAWLSTLALDDGHGKTMQTTLAAAASSGAVATSSVCGRFCGEHEMVVRCLDCGSDTTCVMCMDCFRHSPCVHHRYRINHSSGGGMCDCGDPTAWKPESFCSRHRAAAGSSSAAAADPLDALSEEDKGWVVPVLRGTIQFIAMSLLQHARLRGVLRQSRSQAPSRRHCGGRKGSRSERRRSASSIGSDSTAATAEADTALLHKFAAAASKVDWLAVWLTEVTRQLWELMQASELAKHLVAQLWVEPVALRHSCDARSANAQNEEEEQTPREVDAEADAVLAALPHGFSCVHTVFLYEAAQPVTGQGEPARAQSRAAPWLNHLLRCVGHCVSDAAFRLPIGGLMATYAEYINAHDRDDDKQENLAQYQVQVLTNQDVVRHLMLPSHLPYAAARDTVVHRELSAVLYTLWLAREKPSQSNPVCATEATKHDGLLFVEHQHRSLSLASVTTLQACMTASPAACYTLVLSRLAWRALAQVSGSLGISGYILKDPDAPSETQHYPYPDFMGRFLFRNTWLWLHAIRSVMSALLSDPATVTSTTSDATAPSMPRLSPEAVMAALELPVELWTVWREAVAFDTPPDPDRRMAGLLELLTACRVQRGAAEGLLLLQDGPLAEAQARALTQPSAGADGHAVSAAASSAMGYTVQLLHEVGRTLDVVLDKQRDGFRRGCRAVALERRRASGSSGGGSASSEAEDVMEYCLLEPRCHATTFSNYLPRMFAAVLTAWVIEHQRCTSRRKSTSAAAAAAPTSLHAAARISGLASAGAPSEGEKAGATHVSRPLRAAMDAFFHLRAAQSPARSRLTFAQELLDALAMPYVLTGQVQDGLWRRGDYDVASAVSMYLSYARCVSAEFDMLMLQVLSMELPPADMALQLLQRFSYTKRRGHGLAAASPPPLPPLPPNVRMQAADDANTAPAAQRARRGPKPSSIMSPTGTGATARRHHFRCYLSGYKHLLRLVLTIVTDTAKAAFHAPVSAAVIDRIVGNVLAHGKASHSTIVASVNDTARSGDFGDADDDEKDLSGNVIKFSKLVDAAIHKLAVGENSTHGKVFRLRDTDVWRTHVDLYRVGAVDGLLEKLHGTYRSVVSAVRAARQREESHGEAEADTTTGGSGGTSASSSARVALPPTQLPDGVMYAELLPTTRALLHTDAVLQPALFLLHEYVNSHAPPPAPEDGKAAVDPGSASPPPPPQEPPRSANNVNADTAELEEDSEDTESASSSDGDEDANLISREAVLHATTALYLCMQDCVAITRGMRAVEGIAEDLGANEGSSAASAIDWDLVKLYLDRFCVNESAFTESSRASWLPLPPLTRGTTLLDKLNTAVRLVLPPTAVMAAHATTETSAAMLHRLRAYLLANKDADPYGSLEMVEEVLVRTGLATFSSAAVLAEQKTKDEAALNRKKLIQERQATLMQRMRSRALKTSEKSKAAVAAAAAAADTKAASPATAVAAPAQSVGSPASPTSGPIASLLMKLLMELTTVDCCVCRSATDEPLFLLCHTSTSGVLPHLGALSLPDGRHVHSHLSMCGHAAHKSCVEKVFMRLAVLWQRWNFRSQLYLGPTEFNCPVCTTIITALCPMPALPLPNATTGGGAAGGAADAASPTSPTARRLTSPLSAASPPSLPSAPGVSLFEELQSGTVPAASPRAVDVAAQFHTNLANAAVGFSPSEDVPAIESTEDALQQHNEAAWLVSETIRGFCYAAHLQLEAVKAGQAMNHRDLISLLALLLSLLPAELQRHEVDLRANYARNMQDKESELVLSVLLRPREASQRISAYLLAQALPSMPPDYVRRLLTCVDGDSSSSSEDGGSGEGAVLASMAEALEVDFPDVTVTLWTTAGVLTLLKALVVEDAHHGIVLARGTFTVSGSIDFAALSVASVQTPAARCAAVVRMLQYLLPLSHKVASAPLAVVAADAAACVQAAAAGVAGPDVPPTAGIVLVKPAVTFTTSEQWVAQVAERLLHLPPVYATVLTSFAERKVCAVCRSEPVKPVVCCRCGQLMCLQPPSSPPELYTHTRTCGGAVGVYLFVRTASYYVVELTSGRAYQYPSTYTDEYGEHDRNLRRGIPLFRNAEETQRFVMAWMLNKWGVLSSIFNASNRMDLTVL